MDKKIFIDEAGNTGGDIRNLEQPFFVLTAVMIDNNNEIQATDFLNAKFTEFKEAEETEIKGGKWSKSKNKAHALLELESFLINVNSKISIIVVEKLYMAACLIIDNFFDYVYNNRSSVQWVNNYYLKVGGANYFYESLDTDLLLKAWDVFMFSNEKKDYELLIDEILKASKNTQMNDILEGAKEKLDDFINDNLSEDSEDGKISLSSIPNKTKYAPNFSAFNTVVNMLIAICKEENCKADIIIDEQHQFEKPYNLLYDIFMNMRVKELKLHANATIYSWSNYINSITFGDSKVYKCLQYADMLASSINSMMIKINNNDKQHFLDLDKFSQDLFNNKYLKNCMVNYFMSNDSRNKISSFIFD